MRVLFTVTGAPSHAHEMLVLGRAVLDAGHEVLVATAPSAAPGLRGSGLPSVEALPDQARFWVERLGGVAPPARPGTDYPGADAIVDVIAGRALLREALAGLRPVVDRFQPDLLLRDGMELAGLLVAEERGLPCLTVPSGTTNQLDPAAVLPRLNERRAELDLPTSADPRSAHRHGHVDCLPREYSLLGVPLSPCLAYRPPSPEGRSLPAWVADLDPSRPLVYGAVGIALAATWRRDDVTALAADPVEALDLLVTALSEVDCAAVVSTGGIPVDRVRSGAPHVRVVERAPQPLLLECAQLFVTHAGANSVREGVRAGVPMVATPLFGDQPHNAARVAALGLGLRVVDGSPAELADACRTVLADPGFTARARHARRTLLALPPVSEVVTRLAEIADAARSVVAV
ncbi:MULTISPECIES: glycosyltransferase [Actinosynnema]|uniref:glycosyltransferase n=1 Tax=Actinosynnema TaxID=40566 RepID=UPI0020A3EF6C|nr:glycosyltransferase [Actinosynnema pretiosum]MCP2097576.1 N-glycosyltransferase [Actinosynnema pretiosum]